MVAKYDENGFLGGKIQEWIEVHRRTHGPAFLQAQQLNRENHRFIDGRNINVSDTYQLTTTVLFVRLMELYQGVMVVADRGMAAPTRILFRAFLEAFFHFAAIHKDPKYLDDYQDQFERQRKTLVNRIRHSNNPELEDLRKPIDARLIAEIDQIDVRQVSIEEVARRAGQHNTYLTAYAILSRAVHSCASDLEAYLDYDKGDQKIVSFRYGPTDAETLRTLCLAGMTMAEALKGISLDFAEDRSEYCDKAVESFRSLLPVTGKDNV